MLEKMPVVSISRHLTMQQVTKRLQTRFFLFFLSRSQEPHPFQKVRITDNPTVPFFSDSGSLCCKHPPAMLISYLVDIIGMYFGGMKKGTGAAWYQQKKPLGKDEAPPY
jgi:hypothetical protein